MSLLLKQLKSPKTGQSLIEVLIGVTIAGVLILATGSVLNVSTKLAAQNKQVQSAAFLGQELMENLSIYADSQWYCAPNICASPQGVYNLNKSSTNKYYLDISQVPFRWKSGIESVSNRYFYVENICRSNSTGDITGVNLCAIGSSEDPSTLKATVVVTWQTNGQSQNFSLVKYLMRTRNASFIQTDWSGGSGQLNYGDPTKYDTATNIGDGGVAGTKGSIKIKGY